jgi:hypothetical protein
MNITESEYNQYMYLLESAVKDYCYKINDLYVSLDKLQNNNSIHGKYEGSLTIEEIQELIESFTNTQHKYFKQWYKLNKELQQKGLAHYNSKKIRDIGGYIKGIVKYNDLLIKII